MPVTSADIVNQALQYIGQTNAYSVTGPAPSFDSSPEGIAASKLYAPCVATVGRQFGWDFSRNTVALAESGNPAPFPWAFEYLYPGNGVQIWQVAPATLADLNDPLPVRWAIGNTLVGQAQKKVIWSNQPNAQVVYNNAPSESLWDPGFREAVVRLLASQLAMALTGKPDLMQSLTESAASFENAGEMHTEVP